jgi:hypothetical protein
MRSKAPNISSLKWIGHDLRFLAPMGLYSIRAAKRGLRSIAHSLDAFSAWARIHPLFSI